MIGHVETKNKMKLRAIRSVSGAETAGNNYDDIDRSVLYYSTDKIEHIIEIDVKAQLKIVTLVTF